MPVHDNWFADFSKKSFSTATPVINNEPTKRAYNTDMKVRLSLVVACICLAISSVAFDKIQAELVGTWDYTSMTALKKGKPFGTVHFQPGQWTVIFKQDATWAMSMPPPANPRTMGGTYEVRGHDVDMKMADGKPFKTYHFTIEQGGKILTLRTADVSITASREIIPQADSPQPSEQSSR